MVVNLTQEDIKTSNDYWSTALIGYVLGDAPYEKSMDNFFATVWNFVKKPQIFYHAEGYYLYLFALMKDKIELLQMGPYSYHNKPFILKPWMAEFVFDKEAITMVPLWANLPGLPVGYWSIEALRKVASAIGKPLYTDKYTADINCISYARVLVEVDISRPLVENIEIEAPCGIIQQGVEYDWRPRFCNECIRYGHNIEDCRLKRHPRMEEDQPLQGDEEFKEPRKRRRRGRRHKKIYQHG